MDGNNYFTRHGDQHATVRGWGPEIQLGFGRKLEIRAHKRTDWQYHKTAMKLLYLDSGQVTIIVGTHDNLLSAERRIMLAGDSFRIPAGMRYQFLARDTSLLTEFTDRHEDGDTICVMRGD